MSDFNIDYEFYNKNGYDYFILSQIFNVRKKTLINHISKIRKKYPLQKDWIFTNDLNIDGRIQTVINEECFLFMREVEMKQTRNKIELEVLFFEKRIAYYERVLELEKQNLNYEDMNKKQMQKYFNKSMSTINRSISLAKKYGETYYDNLGRIVVTKKGIELIEKKLFKREYSIHLQRKLAELKKECKQLNENML